MNLIIFGVGIIIGILVRDIKCKTLEVAQDFKESMHDEEVAQFYESSDFKDKFNNAKNIDDIING